VYVFIALVAVLMGMLLSLGPVFLGSSAVEWNRELRVSASMCFGIAILMYLRWAATLLYRTVILLEPFHTNHRG
jgi:hypothetical protein